MTIILSATSADEVAPLRCSVWRRRCSIFDPYAITLGAGAGAGDAIGADARQRLSAIPHLFDSRY